MMRMFAHMFSLKKKKKRGRRNIKKKVKKKNGEIKLEVGW